MPILSDNEITKIAGWPTSWGMHSYRVIAAAAAEACAQLCEEVGHARLAEFHDAPAIAECCAAAIREAVK